MSVSVVQFVARSAETCVSKNDLCEISSNFETNCCGKMFSKKENALKI